MENSTFDFKRVIQNDGLAAFTLELKYPSGTPVDLTGKQLRMQLRDSVGQVAWTFGSVGGDSIITGVANGVEFAEIKSWKIKASTFKYSLRGIDDTGFVTTYLEGSWEIDKETTEIWTP